MRAPGGPPPGALIFLVLALSIFFAAPARAQQSDPEYLKFLVEESIRQGLSEKREWRLLLHYRPDFFGGFTSEADGPGFFLALDGRHNPQAELAATLTKFFSDDPVGTSRQPAQCAFPARYRWLKARLSFDSRRLPEQECERFKSWLSALDPQSVTLIFASAYMNNPSSMFGHTLLRIDQRGQTEQTRLLAYAINFAANADTKNAFAYAFRGITGGFEGYFSIFPYYIKVREYSDMADRDIWEYRLNLTPEEIERMLMHAWELGNTYFDYYFFKENCSYHLLSLLEVARPDLHLTDRFVGWTIPADTVRVVSEQPGLVLKRVYRPSPSTEIRRKRETLSPEEESWLRRVAWDPEASRSDQFALPPSRRALTLDIASDYLRYRSGGEETEEKRSQRILLEARSRLTVPVEEVKVLPFTGPPEEGHRTGRIGLGAGRRGEGFEELAFRLAYHDLLDEEDGYASGAQIELMNGRLRHYRESDRIRLESLTFAGVVSLIPVDSLFMKPSWKLSLGMRTIKGDKCGLCSAYDLNTGVGGALAAPFVKKGILYAFAELEGNYGRAFERNYRAGGGGTGGLLVDISERWRTHLFVTHLAFIGNRDETRLSLQQRYILTKDLALRFEMNGRDHENELLIRLDLYLGV